MINEEQKQAILQMHREGHGKKAIARALHVNVKTVRRILSDTGTEQLIRTTKKDVDTELLKALYQNCGGYIQRIYEKLNEEHSYSIGYSTLSRLLQAKGIGAKEIPRSPHIQVYPGMEMQHDTSPYWIMIAGKKQKVIASGLYFRYSKIRYIQFYPYFTRFVMKCFFHEALMFWKYSAPVCIIDNTNLAVYSGCGKNAVFNGEMETFGRKYGFVWQAHEIKKPNRKAGIERTFYSLETNFFPGRSFDSWADLNQQVLEWSTKRYAMRPHSQTKLIPIELFEEEKKHLKPVLEWIEPPYQAHMRTVDIYGYIAFDANYYWVPETQQQELKILEYGKSIKIFPKADTVQEYQLPEPGIRGQLFAPDNIPLPKHQPNNIKKSSDEEEEKLKSMSSDVKSYVEWILSNPEVIQKPKFIRELYGLSRKVSPVLFAEILKSAKEYQVTSMQIIRNMAAQKLHISLNQNNPGIIECADFSDRESYQEGKFSEETSPDIYSKLQEPSEDPEESHG